jgi:hypothetical protein
MNGGDRPALGSGAATDWADVGLFRWVKPLIGVSADLRPPPDGHARDAVLR